MAADSPAFFRVLGDIYGRRARVLDELGDSADASMTYEDLSSDPAAALALIGLIEPMLADASADAQLKVKDYAPQPLRNMNERQIAALTDDQIAAIGEGLLPYAEAVSALGYGLRS